jgi:hypothetical protein
MQDSGAMAAAIGHLSRSWVPSEQALAPSTFGHRTRRSKAIEFLGTPIATVTEVSRQLLWRLHMHSPPTSSFTVIEV